VTGGTANDQHWKVDYAEIETDATGPGSEFTVTWDPDRDTATITGHCPECRGRTSTKFSTGIPDTVKIRGRKAVPTLPSPVTLYCECGNPHNDRPADAQDRGCGRYWLLHVEAKDRVHPRYRS
jgi:hypothetical protein